MEAERRDGLNWTLSVSILLLAVFGLVVVYSAGQTDLPTAATNAWQRQIAWIGIGLVAAVVSYRFSSRGLESFSLLVYLLAVILLLITLAVGTGAGTAAGVKSWIAIGGVRLGQPAEFAKLALILMLARVLAHRQTSPASLTELLPAAVVAGIPFILVMQQPDLGSAIVFIGILFAMLFWAGVNPWLLVLLASPGLSLLLSFSTIAWALWIVFVSVVLWFIRPSFLESLFIWATNVFMGVVAFGLWGALAPYQRSRLLSFLNPEVDPQATGWHLIQSKVAIGSGGVFGKGYLAGSQKRLAFLPEQHTDFIFSVVGEEFGFLGVVIALVLFAVLLVSLVKIAQRAKDSFSYMVVFGFAGLLVTHVVENVGMTVGLMPITGIPLPLFSYGGSFMLACALGLGVSLRVDRDSLLSGYLGFNGGGAWASAGRN